MWFEHEYMSLNEQQWNMMIILHVNDTVKWKISKLSYTPTT